jgi:hypothetical protein
MEAFVMSDIRQRADKAAAKLARAAKAAERRKRAERLAYSVTEAADALALLWQFQLSGVRTCLRQCGHR